MTSTHLDALMASPAGEALGMRFLVVTLGLRGWLDGLLTLAFYHFSQGVTIVAVLVIVYIDWIIGKTKDRLLVRRWLQMPGMCDVRHSGILLYTSTSCCNKSVG
jgi:hypothetical protein